MELYQQSDQSKDRTDLHTQSPLVRVFLIGPFKLEWRVPSRDPDAWEARTSARALFKLLLCAPNRQASKSQLAGMLWPETDDEKARQSLRTACKVLNKVLTTTTGESLLDTTHRDLLKLADQSHLWVDIDAFEQAITQASETHDIQQTLHSWQEAYRLLRGDFLTDDVLHHWIGTPWIKRRKQALKMARRRVIRQLADIYLQNGQAGRAEDILEAHVARFPTDQDALLRLLRLLAAQNCFSEIMTLYERAEQALAAIGKQPAPHIVAFIEHIQEKLPVSHLPNFPHPHTLPLPAESRPPSVTLPPEQDIFRQFPSFFHTLKQPLLEAMSLLQQDMGRRAYGETMKKEHQIQNTGLSQMALLSTKEGEGTMSFDLSKRETLLKLMGLASTIGILSSQTEIWERLAHAITQPSAVNEITLQRLEHLIIHGWELCNENELGMAERLLGSFLPNLLALPPQEGKQVDIISQGLRLQSVFSHHRLQIAEKILLCEQSVAYARYAHNIDTLVAALIELADAYEFNHQIDTCLQTLQEAIHYCPQACSLVQSRAYSNYAIILAYTGRKREAEFYIQLAQDVFPDVSAFDHTSLLADASIFTLSYHTGLVRLYTGHVTQVIDAFEYYRTRPLNAPIPERLQLELVNGQGKAAIQENELELYAHFLERGLSGALALNSKKRWDEAHRVFQQNMPSNWLASPTIKVVAERFQLERKH